MAEGSELSIQTLATALEKEEKGRGFYKEAMEKCSNPLAKEIFKSLMIDEGVHIIRIKEIYGALKGGAAWSGEWRSHKVENKDLQELLRERAAQFGSSVKGDTGEIEAVDIGIGMEQGAIDFYLEQQGKTASDLEKEFMVQMIEEERSHLRGLEDLKLFLTDPDSWYTEMERHGLDGA